MEAVAREAAVCLELVGTDAKLGGRSMWAGSRPRWAVRKAVHRG